MYNSRLVIKSKDLIMGVLYNVCLIQDWVLYPVKDLCSFCVVGGDEAY